MLLFSGSLFSASPGEDKEVDSLLRELEGVDEEEKQRRIELLLEIGRELYPSVPDSAMGYVSEAERLSRGIGFRSGLISSANLKGVIHYLQGAYAKALPYWKRVLKMKKEKGAPVEIANIRNNLGLLHQKMGAYVKAMKQHQIAHRLHDSLGHKKKMAESLNNLGIVHYEMGNMDHAEKYYKKALKIKKKNGWTEGIHRNYNNLGLVLRARGKDAKALDLYKRALKIYRKKGERVRMGRYHLNIGNAFRSLGKGDTACSHYEKALSLHRSTGNKEGELNVLVAKAKLHKEKGELKKAHRIARKAYRLSDTLASLPDKKEASDILSKVSAAMGNYKKAFEHQSRSTELHDSLLNKEKKEQIAKLEARFQARQKGEDLKELRMKRREAELEQQRTLLIAVGGGGGLLLLLAFLYYAYRQKKKAIGLLTEQNEQIRKQKQEKELLLQELHHRVKNNLQLILSLLNLQTDRIKDEEALQIHKDSQNRVRSMGMLHEKIYQLDELDRDQFEHFVRDLSEHLIETYGKEDSLELQLDIDTEGLGTNTLTPVALILNELLSNALKYGFQKEEPGTISVSVRPEQNDRYLLEVTDNGSGFGNLERGYDEEGNGLDIVRSLTEQLEGELKKKEQEKGSCLQVYFKNIDRI